MKLDLYAVTSLLIGALIAGAIVGGLVVALAARARQLDEGDRAGHAFRELRDAALRVADPAGEATLLREAANIWDRWRPDGLHLDAFYRREANVELTPTYVHRIIDAYATGDPVDLSGCGVPPDVRGRLRAITIGASEATAALPARSARNLLWPSAPEGGIANEAVITAVHPTDVIERWPVRAGASDG